MSFQQGLSGLNATSKSLDVIGNNIANANTYGAKVSRAEFSDMYATALNGAGVNNVGIGVTLGAVSQQFTQGNISTTGNAMDMAINGAGFFQVTDGVSPTVYTRNGQFKVDREGYIVNNEKLKLMGYPADGTGTIQPGLAQPLKLPTAGIAPSATSKIELEFNLKADSVVTAPAATATPQIDFTDKSTYNNATSVVAYDSKGQDVALSYYFQKESNDKWNVYVTANGQPVNVDAAGNPVKWQTLEFDNTTGRLASPDPADALALSITNDLIITDPVTGRETSRIVVPLNMSVNVASATQYDQTFGVTNLTQNGYAAGQLTSIAIEADGIVLARYSNGQSKPAGQLELANFRNPQGLQPLGGNVWASTYASGDAVVGVPSEGNMGVIQAGALEESNIDLTGELVNMITAQRIYQANAQTIKTQDQVMQTLVNMR
ncbi:MULTISPECIES: flagellar hook protein FlgE [Rubrivivax]|uniref:Flagellar hook protein FlgE n=1 Tax=Rubrivivax benzoatilyticus TaxID=316997 RepID=A0ABX0HY02_9BURK|nr:MULTISPECIES: flagellar hook protein FlgE [Rubrivivax]MCD0418474.1 flagellar hook protein FlgE [Rubrivivax sp. JA1024]EGJ09579.1 flagellar basal body and hook protein [Rubrivivax benzoatilyticus JA2 = ATCC BAA-35]MCC9596224.1 flagellar hook protein FlgE [Rubrivivax sp. JA1055]MCC9647435.1 flagellar hook protein FlgE [Rubrivivax sp. JA1029]NHK99875.1 flagellar hook protein FlgE [Rubrivivax benzoatilyticus]